MALSPVRLFASMIVGSTEIICFTRSHSPALIASMNAAELEETSGMVRFYRFRSKSQDLTAEAAGRAEPSIFSAISGSAAVDFATGAIVLVLAMVLLTPPLVAQ